MSKEVFYSVDIETAGPHPGRYALLSIGACLAGDLTHRFYCELQPDALEFEAEALAIHGLSPDRLAAEGLPPAQAMQNFADWIAASLPAGGRPIFLAFNAPFDWMFVNEYFHKYLNSNPFGHNALDIKAFYMGFRRLTAFGAVRADMIKRYPPERALTHNALEDALDQARFFNQLIREIADGTARSSNEP